MVLLLGLKRLSGPRNRVIILADRLFVRSSPSPASSFAVLLSLISAIAFAKILQSFVVILLQFDTVSCEGHNVEIMFVLKLSSRRMVGVVRTPYFRNCYTLNL
uniref:MITD1 C-terminal phospholipase D-like domain-containing protein n=1 Tax=Parascaris univalens TaxID=6257 RepID=A0A915BYE6_PARUN